MCKNIFIAEVSIRHEGLPFYDYPCARIAVRVQYVIEADENEISSTTSKLANL
jgi:hypothetical protein